MIDIILPTFNGCKYLEEQLNSIISQTKDNSWKLLIRDDKSQDLTKETIYKYQNKYPHNLLFINDANQNSGVVLNISYILEYSKSNYILFSDQDDIWLSHKIEITLNKMLQIEKEYGKETPILIHTDLQVVDRNLNLINPSFQKYQNLDPHPKKLLPRLLVQNFVTGCTMMINKPLKELITTIPPEAIMHDWWIALIAATMGKIAYINEPTVLYRQHQNNTIGANNWGINYILSKAKNVDKIKNTIQKTIIQAKKFREIYQDKLSLEQIQIIDTYIDIPNKSCLLRKYLMLKNGYYQAGKLKNLGFFIFI